MHLDHLRLSHSSTSALASCARKIEFAKFYGAPREETNLSGEVGKCLHTGYQEFMISEDRDAAIAAMLIEYPIHLNSNPGHPRSLEACYVTLNAMMDSGILSSLELATIDCLDGVRRPCVEVPFEIRIINFSLGPDNQPIIPVTYVGFMDLIVYDRANDQFVAVDIKTHRLTMDDLTAKFRFDTQVLPYAWVLEKILGRPFNTLLTRYLSVYIDMAEPQIRKYDFIKGEDEIRDWARGLYIDLLQLKSAYAMGWFRRNGNACFNFNKACHFYDICQSRDDTALEQLVNFGNKAPVEKPIIPWVTVDLELAA